MSSNKINKVKIIDNESIFNEDRGKESHLTNINTKQQERGDEIDEIDGENNCL